MATHMNLIDEFGFLKMDQTIDLSKYTICPIKRYNEQLSNIDEYKHKDGFLYPPIVKTYKFDIKTRKPQRKSIPNTARPAQIHRVAVTHQILSKSKDAIDKATFRKGEGHFLLSFIGFLNNTRLQFWDWWWEGRIRVDQKQVSEFSTQDFPDIINLAYDFWIKLPEQSKRIILNAIFLLQRGKALEWEYEKFIHYYISLDAIWKFNNELRQWKHKNRPKHNERITILCDKLDICYKQDAIDKVTTTRNGLFHEGLYGDFTPMSGISTEHYSATSHLDQLIERLIFASFNFKPAFLKLPWWQIRSCQPWS
jgi:hypothetical protein